MLAEHGLITSLPLKSDLLNNKIERTMIMKKSPTLNYPRLSEHPDYKVEADKLAMFNRHLVEAKAKFDRLLQEQRDIYAASAVTQGNAAASAIANAEALLAGENTDPLQTQIETAARMVKALQAAVRQQTVIERRVAYSLSQAAAKDFVEAHKVVVDRLGKAIVELYDANKAEQDFRESFADLGYSENILAPMCLVGGVDDPTDTNGNRSYYWLREAKEYLKSDRQKLEDGEKAAAQFAAEARRKRVESLTANEMRPVEAFFQ